MDSLLNRFTSKGNSILIGFDRIVFKGTIRPIAHATGMESFLVAAGYGTRISSLMRWHSHRQSCGQHATRQEHIRFRARHARECKAVLSQAPRF